MSNVQSRQAFIDTILAEPDVESHRLIFADWLEEHDEPKEAEKFRTLPGLAGVWSSDWGTDQYGTWCAFTVKDVSQKMRWIEPGTFWMGSPEDEQGRNWNESPRHRVTLTQGFWIGSTPCTQAMWHAVVGEHQFRFPGPRHPVETIKFNDCDRFFSQISKLIPGLTLTLPTEAQWEYACRAGTEGAHYDANLTSIAWYDLSVGETHPVGEKQPNAWGLYDMSGNAWEWCLDGLRDFTSEQVMDPVGPTQRSSDRMIRGGSWATSAESTRSARRFPFSSRSSAPDLTFRCVALG